MAKDKDEGAALDIAKLTIAANTIVPSTGVDGNPYALRNEVIVETAKQQVLYKNGYTLPNSARILLNEANSKSNRQHSTTLTQNVFQATGQARSAGASMHHIVASGDARARVSRGLLFAWGIGINDADNGVFLPRSSAAAAARPSSASNHAGVHTNRYHLQVTVRLQAVEDRAQDTARDVLRGIRGELLTGIFPI